MCQITFDVYGCSSNKYLNHESSNFMHSGNRRRGLQKNKNKDISKKTIIPAAKYLNGAKVSTSFGLGLAKLSSLSLV